MNEKIKSISEHTGLAVYSLGLDREKFEKALSRYTTEVVKECAVMCRGEHEAKAMLEHFGVE